MTEYIKTVLAMEYTGDNLGELSKHFPVGTLHYTTPVLIYDGAFTDIAKGDFLVKDNDSFMVMDGDYFKENYLPNLNYLEEE